MPKCVGGQGGAPDPAGELMTLSQIPSRLGRQKPLFNSHPSVPSAPRSRAFGTHLLCPNVKSCLRPCLTRWPWYTNLTLILRKCICVSKMNFLGQGFQKLKRVIVEYRRTRRRIDRCDRKHYNAAFAGGKNWYCTWRLLGIIEQRSTAEQRNAHAGFLEIFAFPEMPHKLFSASTTDLVTSNRLGVRRNSALRRIQVASM